ncbi:MAG: hypothetical protein HY680_03730 [Chloroflexi bacterium]|nr:hypothetical protein [Chloroflexota bacterium]
MARQAQVATNTPAYFEYTGATRLTVVEPITGRRYRFEHPGALVAVDERDSSSFVVIPHVRWIKTPVVASASSQLMGTSALLLSPARAQARSYLAPFGRHLETI